VAAQDVAHFGCDVRVDVDGLESSARRERKPELSRLPVMSLGHRSVKNTAPAGLAPALL